MNLKRFYVVFYGAVCILVVWMLIQAGRDFSVQDNCRNICAKKNMTYKGTFVDDSCACEKGPGVLYRLWKPSP